MGHYAGEMSYEHDEFKKEREPIRPYIIMECQTEDCHNKGNKWIFNASNLKVQTGFKPGLVQMPVGIRCDQCHCEPTIIKQEWRVP